MKKLLFCVVLFLGVTTLSNAQIRLGLGLGYAMPTGDITDNVKGGLSVNAEAGYGITDHLDLSVMYQGDFLVADEVNGVELGKATLSSVLVNGRFYIVNKVFKPYVSLGLGMTHVKLGSFVGRGGVDIEEQTVDPSIGERTDVSGSNFALRPGVGFKVGSLNVSASYLNAGKIEDLSVGDVTFTIGTIFSIGI